MTVKADENRHCSFLRLVVNSGRRIDYIGKEESLEPDDNAQFEMFGRSDSILFAEVRTLVFSDIKNLINKHHIHHIIDLREVPYLNFGGSNRDSFFRYLQRCSVDYLSLFSVASQSKKPSIDELFEDDSGLEALTEELVNWIGKGPTMVLINQDRKQDPIAKSFSTLLKKSNISFSETLS